jgi:hypothetical protein
LFALVGALTVLVVCFLAAVCLIIRRRFYQAAREAERERIIAAGGLPGRRIPAAATAAQIDAIPLSVFQVGMFPPEDAMCSVCLGEYEINQQLRTLPCAHHFHQPCLDEWLTKSTSCPLCLQNIETANDVHQPAVAMVPLSTASSSTSSTSAVVAPMTVTVAIASAPTIAVSPRTIRPIE